MIPYNVGKLVPSSSHLTRGLVKYVPGRDYFRDVPSQNGEKFVTSPPPPIVEWLKRGNMFCRNVIKRVSKTEPYTSKVGLS